MERICEFCAGLRPIIYCKPDAAHLCLSCDAKVHSANALSGRHLRTLLCEFCRNFPTALQCLDHQMFLCRRCDRSLHDMSSRHQKRTIRGYMGCPSARDFAALWGFEINKLDDISRDRFVFSCDSENSSITSLDIQGQTSSQSGDELKVEPLTQQTQAISKGRKQRTFILQQILDVSWLGLINRNDHSPFIHGEEKDDISSSMRRTPEKFDAILNQYRQHSKDIVYDVQQRDSLLQELKVSPLPSPFFQLENLPSSSAIVLPFHGESLWQCKSPAESSQLWSQNMQDLGVCDDLVCHDDFNIPEVDLTFQNFEDIFNGDQDPIRWRLDTKDDSISSMDRDMSLDKSDNHLGKGMEESSVTSSTHISPSAVMDKDMDSSDQVYNPANSTESARPIQPSYSTLSGSDSRLSVDSAGSGSLDRTGDEPSCISPRHDHSMAKNGITVTRNREKKQSQAEMQEKRTRQPSYRKSRSLMRKRINGEYSKTEKYETDIVAMISPSY